MTRRFAAVGALVAALLAVLVPAAAGQEDTEGLGRLQIRSIDSRDASSIAIVVDYSGDPSDLESASIAANGESYGPDAVAPLPPSLMPTVIAVDTSQWMDEGGALVQTREAIAEFIQNRPEGQRVGIVSFGGRARVVQRLTTDTDRLVAAVEGLAPSGGTALWNGISSAAGLLEDAEGAQGNIVVIAGGPNDASSISASRARGRVISTEATVYGLGVEGRGVNPNDLRSLASATGGVYRGQENPSAIGDAFADTVADIANQYVITFDSDLARGPVDLTLEVGDLATSVSFVSGGVAAGASSLRPVVPTEPGGVGFFRENGFLIGLALVVLAVCLGIYAVVSLVMPDGSSLDSVLEQYTEPGTPSSVDLDEGGSGLAKTAFIKRAVSMTEGFAERQGFLASVEGKLERANLPLRAAEALFFYAAGVVLVLVASFAISGGNIVTAVVVTGLIALVPPAAISFLASRRQKKFVSLLPDTLQLLAGTLRAGYSLMQGVEAVSREVEDPMGQELRRVVTESRLGRPLEESLEASAERMSSDDFAWAVMAIRIQREVGGNLADLLLTVADTMTQRERLRRDVAALTAEGKISAIVLGLLPIGLGLAMWVLNPDYISRLFDTTLGNFLLGGAILLASVGFYWMKKVIEVDI